MVDAYAIGDPRWKDIKPVSLEELVNNVDGFSFEKILINPELIVNNKITWHFTNKENPIVVGEALFLGKIVGFEEEYYKENKEQIDKVLLTMVARNNSDHLTLYEDNITPEMLRAVAKNPFIKRIYLGDREYVHNLTVEEYEILKKSGIESIISRGIVPELEGIFGAKIDYNDQKQLIGCYRYEDLNSKRLTSLTFSEPVKDEEIENLKYIKDGLSIFFDNYDDFENIFKVIDRLESLGKDCSYSIRVQSSREFDYKNKFNSFIFAHPEYLDNDKIQIGVGILETYSLVDYVKYEKRLIELIKPAINLSPFEKYLFAYNIVKQFKEYKENDNDKSESRDLYKLLDGDYMVCVGYATLLRDLLNKLGINSSHYSVGVDTGFDKVENDALIIPDDVVTNRAGHARLKVHLVDPKYDIDGFYFADPTWDNEMDEDAYNFSAMTPNEYNGLYRYNFLDFCNVDELFFVNSLEEFYEKANLWMRKNLESKSKFSESHIRDNLEAFKRIASDLVVMLKEYEPEKIEFIKMVYANIFRMNIPASNIPGFVNRIEEIVAKVDDPDIKSKFKSLCQKKDSIFYGKESMKKKQRLIVVDFMNNMLKELENLDPEKARILKEKYHEIDSYGYVPDDDLVADFMYEVGNYILNKTQTEIVGDQYRNAIREVYKISKKIPEDKLEEELDKVMAYNIRRQRLAFPVRYKVLDDGRKIPILNETNKFEIGEGKELTS